MCCWLLVACGVAGHAPHLQKQKSRSGSSCSIAELCHGVLCYALQPLAGGAGRRTGNVAGGRRCQPCRASLADHLPAGCGATGTGGLDTP